VAGKRIATCFYEKAEKLIVQETKTDQKIRRFLKADTGLRCMTGNPSGVPEKR